MRNIARIVLAAAAAVTLAGCGAASADDAAPQARTVTRTTEVTPASCVQALTLADRGFGLAARGFDASADAMTAAANFDVAGINASAVRLVSIGGKVEQLGPGYRSARDECLASAE